MSPIPRTLILAAALCVAGCTGGLLQSHAPRSQLYVLRAAPSAAAAQAKAAGSLRVLRPLPAPGLDGDHLGLLQAGNRLDYYTGGRWSAPLPDVLQDLAVAVLRQAGAWTTVADARASFNADYQLQLYIDHFEAVYPDGAEATSPGAIPVVTVGLRGVLVRRSDGAIVANLTASASQQAAANRLGAVVESFEAAANGALAQVAAQASSAR